MRGGVFLAGLMVVAGMAFSLAGCSPASSPAPSPQGEGAPAAAETGHDHGEEAGEHAGHDHATQGPHGGDLIVLGDEEYHAELLHDEATHTVEVHLLDAAGKEHVPIPEGTITLQLFQNGQFVDYTLTAKQPAPAGASEFVLTDEELADTLLHGAHVQGRLRVTIGGQEYIGRIEHQPRDHDGHDHAQEAPDVV